MKMSLEKEMKKVSKWIIGVGCITGTAFWLYKKEKSRRQECYNEYIKKALQYAKAGEHESAIAEYEKAYKYVTKENIMFIINEHIKSLLGVQKIDEAISLINRIIDEYPNSDELIDKRMDMFISKGNRWAAARDMNLLKEMGSKFYDEENHELLIREALQNEVKNCKKLWPRRINDETLYNELGMSFSPGGTWGSENLRMELEELSQSADTMGDLREYLQKQYKARKGLSREDRYEICRMQGVIAFADYDIGGFYKYAHEAREYAESFGQEDESELMMLLGYFETLSPKWQGSLECIHNFKKNTSVGALGIRLALCGLMKNTEPIHNESPYEIATLMTKINPKYIPGYVYRVTFAETTSQLVSIFNDAFAYGYNPTIRLLYCEYLIAIKEYEKAYKILQSSILDPPYTLSLYFTYLLYVIILEGTLPKDVAENMEIEAEKFSNDAEKYRFLFTIWRQLVPTYGEVAISKMIQSYKLFAQEAKPNVFNIHTFNDFITTILSVDQQNMTPDSFNQIISLE